MFFSIKEGVGPAYVKALYFRADRGAKTRE